MSSSLKGRVIKPNLYHHDDDFNGGQNQNHIRTTKYTWWTFIPKNLFEQFYRFANLYFLMIQILNWLPGMEVFVREIQLMPLLFVLLVTAIKDLFEDRRRKKFDKRVNNLPCRRYEPSIQRFVKIKWEQVNVGDLIHLSCNELVPADILILRAESDEEKEQGTCFVNTSNLDGENNLKQRFVVPKFSKKSFNEMDLNFEVECEKPNQNLLKLRGFVRFPNGSGEKTIPITQDNFLLRDCILKNTSYAQGIVIYAGQETKIMMNSQGTRCKRSRLEKTMNADIVMCLVVLSIMCIINMMGRYFWLDIFIMARYRRDSVESFENNQTETKPYHIPFLLFSNHKPNQTNSLANNETINFLWPLQVFITFVILYQMIIPISLYVCVEMVKLGQVYFINRDKELVDTVNKKRVECRAWNITEDLGQIEYMFCDKTGTLTENVMEFRCCFLNGLNYSHYPPGYRGEVSYVESFLSLKKSCKVLPNRSLASILRKIGNKLSDIHLREDKIRNLDDDASLSSSATEKDDNDDEDDEDEKTKNKPKKKMKRLTKKEIRAYEFFLLLAICNTAVPSSKTKHEDILDDHGQELSQTRIKVKRQEQKQLKKSLSQKIKENLSAFTNLFRSKKLKRKKSEDEDEERDNTKTWKNKRKSVRIPKIEQLFESESPDEVALVSAACAYKFALMKRTKSFVNVTLPSGLMIKYTILHLLSFDSDRKRMSVIIKCPFTDQIILLCKGSDQTVMEKLSENYLTNNKLEQELSEINEQLSNYSNKGLRVMCMARRVLSPEVYKKWTNLHDKIRMAIHDQDHDQQVSKVYDNIESDLEILGITAIEDRLQYRVPEAIDSFKRAGIVIWVLTGDKMETAVSIGKSCSLFNSKMTLLTLSWDNVKSKKMAQLQLLKLLNRVKKQILKNYQLNKDLLRELSKNQEINLEESSFYQWMRRLYDMLTYQPKVELKEDSGSAKRKKRSKVDMNDEEVYNSQKSRSLFLKNWGLVIDGPSLSFVLEKSNIDYFIELTKYCGSVMCCRVTPSQKALVVSSVKNKLDVMTMAVGDGANDVAMIQNANVGIGILGLESTQAAMSSDFVISKFHFLERLVLVHGNLCYNRLAHTILYFFYKNTLVIFVIFFYQFYCGFSGTSNLDDIYLMAVNVLYTTFPAVVRGILEKDCDEQVFLKYPELYARGRKSTVYTEHSFWVNTTDSIYQGFVIYFLSFIIYRDTNVDIYEFGLALFILIVTTNLLHIAVETKYWNQWYVFSFLLSIGCLMFTILFLDFNYSYTLISILGGHNYRIFLHCMMDRKFWYAFLIVPVVSLMPRVSLRFIQNVIKPSLPIPKNT